MKLVLVANDQPNHLILITTQLLQMDLQVVTVVSRADAMAIINAVDLDLIIVDLILGDDDGWEMIQTIRQHQRTQKTPIMAVSVMNTNQDVERVYSVGADFFLPKPFTPTQLRSAVQRVLRQEPVD
ncbi:MAG: response regulator [bacterium]|nr:response regulator [bacterium]